MSAIFSEIGPPPTPCPHFGLISSTKITQPPSLCLLLPPAPFLADVLYEWSLTTLIRFLSVFLRAQQYFSLQMKSRQLIVVDIGMVTPGYSLLRDGAWVRDSVAAILGDVDCQQESSFKEPQVRESAKVPVENDWGPYFNDVYRDRQKGGPQVW